MENVWSIDVIYKILYWNLYLNWSSALHRMFFIAIIARQQQGKVNLLKFHWKISQEENLNLCTDLFQTCSPSEHISCISLRGKLTKHGRLHKKEMM